MIERNHEQISLKRQCQLLDLNRSTLYYNPVDQEQKDAQLAALINDIYLESGCRFGYRKVAAILNRSGYSVNHKRVLRIMRDLSIQGIYPARKVKKPEAAQEQRFEYLLDGLAIEQANQVWATDITYIRIPQGFLYLVAIIDWFSRFIVGHKLAVTLETENCIDPLLDAFDTYGLPQIFNTDLGTQFTSSWFTQTLLDRGIRISMTGKGCCFDNIRTERFWRTFKQEEMRMNPYDSVPYARSSVNAFIQWYNYKRPHQSLAYKVPAEVYLQSPQYLKGVDQVLLSQSLLPFLQHHRESPS